jgi:hypothetical protein
LFNFLLSVVKTFRRVKLENMFLILLPIAVASPIINENPLKTTEVFVLDCPRDNPPVWIQNKRAERFFRVRHTVELRWIFITSL